MAHSTVASAGAIKKEEEEDTDVQSVVVLSDCDDNDPTPTHNNQRLMADDEEVGCNDKEVDESTLLPLSAKQATETRFPPGCPVWYDLQKKSDAEQGRTGARSGIVEKTFADFTSMRLAIRVIPTATDSEGATEGALVWEDHLAYATDCLVKCGLITGLKIVVYRRPAIPAKIDIAPADSAERTPMEKVAAAPVSSDAGCIGSGERTGESTKEHGMEMGLSDGVVPLPLVPPDPHSAGRGVDDDCSLSPRRSPLPSTDVTTCERQPPPLMREPSSSCKWEPPLRRRSSTALPEMPYKDLCPPELENPKGKEADEEILKCSGQSRQSANEPALSPPKKKRLSGDASNLPARSSYEKRAKVDGCDCSKTSETKWCILTVPLWVLQKCTRPSELFVHLAGQNKGHKLNEIERSTNCVVNLRRYSAEKQIPLIITINAGDEDSDIMRAKKIVEESLLGFLDDSSSKGRLLYELACMSQGNMVQQSSDGCVLQDTHSGNRIRWMKVIELPHAGLKPHGHFLTKHEVQEELKGDADCSIEVFGFDGRVPKWCKSYVLVTSKTRLQVIAVAENIFEKMAKHQRRCPCHCTY
ncbi:hypothetical protein ACHAWF_016828 [Thalassiosira exigua]